MKIEERELKIGKEEKILSAKLKLRVILTQVKKVSDRKKNVHKLTSASFVRLLYCMCCSNEIEQITHFSRFSVLIFFFFLLINLVKVQSA